MLEGDNIVSAARRAILHLKQTKPDFDTTLQVGTHFLDCPNKWIT